VIPSSSLCRCERNRFALAMTIPANRHSEPVSPPSHSEPKGRRNLLRQIATRLRRVLCSQFQVPSPSNHEPRTTNPTWSLAMTVPSSSFRARRAKESPRFEIASSLSLLAMTGAPGFHPPFGQFYVLSCK